MDTQSFPQRFVSKYDFIDEAHGKTPVRVSESLANDLAQFDTENGNDVFVKIWEEFSFWIANMPAMGSDAAFIGGFSGLPHNVMVDMHVDYQDNQTIRIEYEPTYAVELQTKTIRDDGLYEHDPAVWLADDLPKDDAIKLADEINGTFADTDTSAKLFAEVYECYDTGEFENGVDGHSEEYARRKMGAFKMYGRNISDVLVG